MTDTPFTTETLRLADAYADAADADGYANGNDTYSARVATREALLAHLRAAQAVPTPAQYCAAHLYLRERECDMGAGELDELLAIFGLTAPGAKT